MNLETERIDVKTQDEETGFYYFGARYLNPKTSMWISADPAMGEYVPRAPIDDEAKKHNQSLPGMGGVYNYVNFHVYHYAGNNPVKYVDPDGRAAWEPTSSWDASKEKEFRNKFADNAIRTAQSAINNDETVDCADVALTALAETAASMGLELTFTVWDSDKRQWMDVSSSDSRFDTKEEFIEYIRTNMGAITLLDDRTTELTNVIRKGDLAMFDLRSSRDPRYDGHTIIIIDILNVPKRIVNTVQGHISGTPTIERYVLGGTVDGVSPQYRRFRFDKLFK